MTGHLYFFQKIFHNTSQNNADSKDIYLIRVFQLGRNLMDTMEDALLEEINEVSREDLKLWMEDYDDDNSIAFSDESDFETSSEMEENVRDEPIQKENASEEDMEEEKVINYEYYKYQYGAHISEYTSKSACCTRDVTSAASEVLPGYWPPGMDIMHATELDIVTMVLETLSGFQNDLFLRINTPKVVFILTHTARHIALSSLSCGSLTSVLSKVAELASKCYELRMYVNNVSRFTSGTGYDACGMYNRSIQCSIAVSLQRVLEAMDSQLCDMSMQLTRYTKQLELSNDDATTPLPVTLVHIALFLSKWTCIITSISRLISNLSVMSGASPQLLQVLHMHCTTEHLLALPPTLTNAASPPAPHELHLQLSLPKPSPHHYSSLANSLYTSLLCTYLTHHLQHIWTGGQSSFSVASDAIMLHLDPAVKRLVTIYNNSASDVHLMSRFPQGLKYSGCFSSSRDYLRTVEKALSSLEVCLRVSRPVEKHEETEIIDILQVADWLPYTAKLFSNISELCGNICKPTAKSEPVVASRRHSLSATALDDDLYPFTALLSSLVSQPLTDVLSSLQLSAMHFYHHRHNLNQQLYFFRDIFLLSDSSIFTPLRELAWTVAMSDDNFTYDIFDIIRSNILSRFPESESKCSIPYHSSSNSQSLQHIYQYASQLGVEVYFVYPLNELFHEASIMRTYSSSMRHLLQLYACIWIIEGVWKKLSSTDSNLAQLCKAHEFQNNLTRRMFILRNRCMIRLSWVLYILKGVQFYYMNTIHAEIFSVFLNDVNCCPSISAFRTMHANALDNISAVLSLEMATISNIVNQCIASVIRLDEANTAADVYSGFAHTQEEQELMTASLELADKEFSKLWKHVNHLHAQLRSISRRRHSSKLPEYALRLKGLIGDEYEIENAE